MKKNLTIYILFLLLPISLLSEADKHKLTGTELLQMSESQVFKVVEKLNKEETAELIIQIRGEARKEYKDIDKFHLLISHLESIKAINEEQSRLKSLNLVYGLGLFLIIGLLGYILYSQRKTINSLNQLLK